MADFFEGIWQRLAVIFDPSTVGASMAAFLTNVLIATLTFAVFYLLWRMLMKALGPATRKTGLDATAISFVQTMLKFGVLGFGLITALGVIGINTASLVASLGIAGLTLGFAAQDALSNIISGLFIFWDRPFVIGDLIEVEDTYGRVDQITLRTTRVVTPDGRMLAIPNSVMVNTMVASYTNFPHLRLDIEVTIGVNEDIDRVRRLALDQVKDDPEYMTDPAPRVVVTQLNDYNVAVELQVWIDDERIHRLKRYALREALYLALNEAGVDMPYETLALTPLHVNVAQN